MKSILAIVMLCFSTFAFAQKPDILEVVDIMGEIDANMAASI